MEGAATERSPAARRLVSAGLLLFWSLAAAASWIHFQDDRLAREASARFVERFHVEERYPAYAETIRYAPAADLAAEVASDVAIQDTNGAVSLAALDDATRALWIEAVASFDDELLAARELQRDAIRARPGWPSHRVLLGQAVFLRASRTMQLATRPELWFVPLHSALADVPGDEAIAAFTSNAMIEAWPYLGNDLRQRGPETFRVALRDRTFVAASYLNLLDLLGHDAVFELLPAAAASLRAAMQAEGEVGDVEAVARLFPMWERAEWNERSADLARIGQRVRLGDVTGALRSCRQWTSRHAIEDFDSPAGRRQIAALLEAWPAESGMWHSDPRAEILRFILNGRTAGFDGRAASSAASQLAGIPAPIAARLTLLAGDVNAAESLARASETAGSFEWTRFYVELAYRHLADGRRDEAARALELVAVPARGECDVVVARQVLAAADDKSFPAPVEAEIGMASWSRLKLPLCIAGDNLFEADLDVAGRGAVLSFGFNEGRAATFFAPPGRAQIRMPVGSRRGRNIFEVRKVAGGDVTPLRAALRAR